MDRRLELLQEDQDFKDKKKVKTFPLSPWPPVDVIDTLRPIVEELEVGAINAEEAYRVTQAMDWHMRVDTREDETVMILQKEITRRVCTFTRGSKRRRDEGDGLQRS